MHANLLLDTILRHTVDAPYTVEEIEPLSPATIRIRGCYRIDQGRIEDQLTLGLRTYFRVQYVTSGVNEDEDGWIRYSAELRRQPAFAQVPNDVAR